MYACVYIPVCTCIYMYIYLYIYMQVCRLVRKDSPVLVRFETPKVQDPPVVAPFARERHRKVDMVQIREANQ